MDHSMHGSASGSGMNMDSSMHMAMGTFHWSATGDALWFNSWMPKSEADYIGACFGLFFFTILSRGLSALEIYFVAWSAQRFHQTQQEIQSRSTSSKLTTILSRIAPQIPQLQSTDIEKTKAPGPIALPAEQEGSNTPSSRHGSLFSSAQTAYPEPLQLPVVPPFVWHNDLIRSVLTTLGYFVNYLLMLVVMTGNGGFFIVIIAGIFVGEMIFGRFRSLGRFDTDHSH